MRRSLVAPLALVAGLASLAAPGSALADSSGPADAVQPVISGLGGDPADAGYLEFHAVSDTAIDPASISAQLTLRVSGDRPTTTVTGFSLVSGSAQDGTWRSSDRLELGAHGIYDVTVDLADADGDHPAPPPYPGQGTLDYQDLPVFTGASLDRTTVDFDHQQVTATGTVSTFDPASGLTTPGWTDSEVYLHGTRGSGPWDVPADVRADGSFTVTGPVYNQVYVYAVQRNGETVNTGPVTVTKVSDQTRIVFDAANATARYGSSYTVHGTAEYLSTTTGAWTPLPAGDPDTEVLLSGPNGVHGYELGTGGTFSESLAAVTGDTSWTAAVGGFGFLQQGSGQTDLRCVYPAKLVWSDHTFSGAGVVKIEGTLSAAPGPVPTGHVQLQQSADGRTGWTTVATVTPGVTGAFNTSHIMSRPTGYLRLYYPGSASATAATSPAVHLTRAVTRITGFNASPEPVRKGSTITVTGVLQRRSGATWSGVSGQTVTVWFRVHGGTTAVHKATVKTGTGGRFTVHFTAAQDGTWYSRYTATSAYLNSASSGDYVDVR